MERETPLAHINVVPMHSKTLARTAQGPKSTAFSTAGDRKCEPVAWTAAAGIGTLRDAFASFRIGSRHQTVKPSS
jgi:hypothetical protein